MEQMLILETTVPEKQVALLEAICEESGRNSAEEVVAEILRNYLQVWIDVNYNSEKKLREEISEKLKMIG